MATTTPADSTPMLDHVVILVPLAALDSVPAFLTSAFTVVAGGTHADGATANKLVLLADGTYLELIAFTAACGPEQRARHRWGSRPEGRVVDWALTLPGTGAAFGDVQGRVAAAGAGVRYADPVAGGRVRPDGVELRWAVAAPRAEGGAVPLGAGEAPFWCLDRTPRARRVQHHVPANVAHPSRAVGMARVRVAVRDEAVLEALRRVYDAICGAAATPLDRPKGYRWDVAVPVPGRAGAAIEVRLSGEDAPGEGNYVRLALFTDAEEDGKIEGELVDGWTLGIDLVRH